MSAPAPADAPADAPTDAPADVPAQTSTHSMARIGHNILAELWTPVGRLKTSPRYDFRFADDIEGAIRLGLDACGEPRYRPQFMLDLLTGAIEHKRDTMSSVFVPYHIYVARAAFDAAVHADREAPRPAKRARIATE